MRCLDKESFTVEKIYDVVVIGGGPAGYTAALYATRAGLDTLVLEKFSAGGQMTETQSIDNYPGFDEGVDGFTLGMKMQAGAERFGAKTVQTEVLSCELSSQPKKIVTDSGEILAKAVIIATGAGHKHLGVADEEKLVGRGVGYCAACDGMLYRGKTVAVVGGGNSAAADALLLSKICKKVYLIHRRDALRATKLYQTQLENTSNVELCYNAINDGAAGVDMGRNVFQSDAPEAMIQAVYGVVHNGLTPQQGYELYQELKNR